MRSKNELTETHKKLLVMFYNQQNKEMCTDISQIPEHQVAILSCFREEYLASALAGHFYFNRNLSSNQIAVRLRLNRFCVIKKIRKIGILDRNK